MNDNAKKKKRLISDKILLKSAGKVAKNVTTDDHSPKFGKKKLFYATRNENLIILLKMKLLYSVLACGQKKGRGISEKSC